MGSVLLFALLFGQASVHGLPQVAMPRAMKDIGKKAADGMESIRKAPSRVASEMKKREHDLLRPEANAIRSTEQMVHNVQSAVSHAGDAAKNADKLLDELRPPLRDLDQAAKMTVHLAEATEPTLQDVRQAALRVQKLAESANLALEKSRPTIDSMGKTAVRAEALVESAAPLVEKMTAAAYSADQTAAAAKVAVANLTQTLQDFDGSAQALQPVVVSLGHLTDKIAIEIDAAGLEVHRVFAVLACLTGAAIFLHMCILLAKLCHMVRHRQPAREPLMKTEMSFADQEMGFQGWQLKGF